MTTEHIHKLTNEQLINCYYNMLLIRRFEEKSGQLYGMGLIGGFCHLYIGQEAVAVGIQNSTIQETLSLLVIEIMGLCFLLALIQNT